ncbi:hypothetical protein OH76DRAFT_1362217, partial [Lentinus brumalis]
PFRVGDPISIQAYRSLMDLRAAHSLRTPLYKGFTIGLNFRLPPPRQPLSHPRSTDPLMPTDAVRKAPHPPTEVDMTYILCKPLQTGPEYESEVWLAQPCQPFSPGAPTSQVVLKFVIPSRLPRPPTELTEGMLHHEFEYTLPGDVLDCEVRAYEWLQDLQGSNMPYYYGVHQVTMPWDEVAYVIALEHVSESLSLSSIQRCIDPPIADDTNTTECTKYRDFASYVKLFTSALSALQRAHSWHIHHLDVNGDNILVDETHDHAVLIDWCNIAHLQVDEGNLGNPYEWARSRDLHLLLHTFAQCEEHYDNFAQYVRDNHPDFKTHYVPFKPNVYYA